MIIFAIIIIGLMIGSFLNVCIYRMPSEKSIVTPRSYCPRCKHQVLWYDNIPVLSFILLLGKCRFCKKSISLRYITVEVLTALIFAVLVSKLGLNATTVIYMVLSCGMIVATFIDFEHQIIPDEITYGGMVLGVIASFVFPQLHNTSNRLYALRDSLFGLILGGALIYLIAMIGTIIFKKKLEKIGQESAMGGGDIKYLAMIGAFLGWQGAIFVFFLAPFLGSFVGIMEKIRKRADVIPYGPYLSAAAFVAILWGDRILRKIFT